MSQFPEEPTRHEFPVNGSLGRYEKLSPGLLARFLAIKVARATGGRVLDGSFSQSISACLVRLPFDSNPLTVLKAVKDLDLLGVPRVLSLTKHVPSAVYLWVVKNSEGRSIHIVYTPISNSFLLAAERPGDLLPKRNKPTNRKS